MTIRYKKGSYSLDTYPIADATAIDAGDQLKLDTGLLVKAAAAGDNLTFVGVAFKSKEANDGQTEISVYRPMPDTEFEGTLDAATTVVTGDNLQIDDPQVLKKSDTDAVARVTQGGTSLTKVLFRYKLSSRDVGDAS